MDSSQKASLIYDKVAGLYAAEFSEPTCFLEEFAKLLPAGAKVLDAGCGVGVDAAELAAAGASVIAVDQSEGMLALGKATYPQLDFRLGDMRRLKFPDGHFDGIVAAFSLIHLPKSDVPATLAAFHRLLKLGGLLFIALQSGESAELVLPEPLKPDEEVFVNVISQPEIRDLLEASGFDIVSKERGQIMSPGEFDFEKLYLIGKVKT